MSENEHVSTPSSSSRARSAREDEDSLVIFCLLPWDLVHYIFTRLLDPKTRTTMSQTCSRLLKLFLAMYPHPFQRRWMYFGKEPPGFLHPEYLQCTGCNAVFSKYSKHTCTQQHWLSEYCFHCMYPVSVNHNSIICTERNKRRCIDCGKWHRDDFPTCAFKPYNCDSCGGRHVNLVCPNIPPRCRTHRIYQCYGCDMVIDPMAYHRCETALSRVKRSLGIAQYRLWKDGSSIYVPIMNTLYVSDPDNIPSLLQFDHVTVRLAEFSEEMDNFLMEHTLHGTDCQVGEWFPEKFCQSCMTTVQAKLKRCSGCRAVWYCGVECQKLHWKAHKKECLLLKNNK